jgi:hypothetical protein
VFSVGNHHPGDYSDEYFACATAFVGVAFRESSAKSVLDSGGESLYDATLCDRYSPGEEGL